VTTVHVSASREYDVLIGRGLLERLGETVRACTKAQTAVVVAGDIVFPLYGSRAIASLEAAGLRTLSYVIPHGSSTRPWRPTASFLSSCPKTA